MAIVERGKGRNRHTIEFTQTGSMLRMQEAESSGPRLPGYRRFSTADAARRGLVAEIRTRLAEGMKPGDEDARAIAAEAQPPRPKAPALPLRCDVGIYNEATGFVVTSRRMAGRTLEDGSPEWKKAVGRGDLLPLSLVQDDSFVIRIVAGEALTAREDEEWVSRVDWHLNVPDGRLCVTGGSVLTNEDYDESEAYSEQFVGEVAIPKGRYRASLYSMLHGINGDSVLDHLAGGHRKAESREDWFDRTRPGREMPDDDAGEGPERVGFLLHLEPVSAAPKTGLSGLPEDGWFSGVENARKPELCPLGLEASNVQRRSTTESGEWTYVHDVFSMLGPKWGATTPASLSDGGTVTLPVASLAHAARLAWFASRRTLIEWRAQPPAGVPLDLDGAWPEGVVAAEEAGLVRLLFSADLEPVTVLERVSDLAARLRNLPDGTMLDLCAAPQELVPGTPEAAGWLWLRGPLRGGAWTIARALPVCSSARLRAALALASEMDGARLRTDSRAEGDAILTWARRNFGDHLRDNPPKAAADAITFRKPGYEVELTGAAAFAVRFADIWPVWTASSVTEDDAEDEDEDDGMFPMQPIKGALLHTTAGGRAFHQTMALLVSQGVADAVKAQEKDLRKAGFKEMGDVMSPEFEQIAFHGYLGASPGTLAWFRVSFPDEAMCELLSLFEGGALLLTSASANIKNRASRGVHVQEFFGASPADLVAHHEKRLTELRPTLGDPRPHTPGVRSLAEALAVVLEKD